MRRIRNSDPYQVINLIFIGIILLIVAYSFFYSAEGRKHPLPSGTLVSIQSSTSLSTGLSRSFSEIVRFQFDKARSYNPHGLRIFSFFVLQLLMRVTALLLLLSHGFIHRHTLALADVILSALLFGVLFFPFIRQLMINFHTL